MTDAKNRHRIVVLALNELSTPTEWLSKALAAELCVIRSRPPYARLLKEAGDIIKRRRPSSIIVQLPSGPPLGAVLLLRAINRGFTVIADAHTGFISSRLDFTRHGMLNAPFKRLLPYCDLVMIHNELNYAMLPVATRSKSMVVYAPFYVLKQGSQPSDSGPARHAREERYAVLPASWHPDEPIETIANLWTRAEIPFPLLITGKPTKDRLTGIGQKYDANGIVLTGRLGTDEYYALLRGCTFVVCVTTSPLDFQCSAYEALALMKPVVASETPALRQQLGHSAAYFRLDEDDSLREAVGELLANRNDYQARIGSRSLELEALARTMVRQVYARALGRENEIDETDREAG